MQQDARFELGNVYRMQGKTAEALATFREFRKISPGDPRAWTGLAQTYQDAKQYKEAEKFLLDEITADPKKEAARFKLAEIYSLDKLYDPALDQLKILVAAHPQSSDLHAAMGDTLRKKGDKKGAIEYFRKAVALNPNSPGPMVALAMVLQEYDDIPESRGLYEKIIKIEPDNVIALNNLAFIKAEDGSDIDGALTMAQKAKQKEPNVATISDTLGWIYIKKNLPDDAIRIYTEICRQEPDNAMFRYHLAQALVQKGDKLKAKSELNEALTRIKSHPDEKYEKKIRELMTKLA
jgi:predicted Zn-dependent protease